jgi:hypothetical protein
MLDPASVEALSRSFVLGTGRHGAALEQAFGGLIEPGDQKATLKALALLGQHGRYRRPAPGAHPVSTEPLYPDERMIIPGPARPLLISLLGRDGAGAVDPVAMAVADAMERKRLRLHPFDLRHLDDFVKTHGEQLGASAVAWANRHAEATTPDTYSFVETIDETNWSQGRPAQKAAFIRATRAADPARARALVEGAFAREPAPVRLVLVKALANNPSAADGPFLEGLAKDRAPSVREAAERLLARLPGSPQAAKHLQDCLSRIKKTKGGVLRRRAVLHLEYPATINGSERVGWVIMTLGTIALDELAKGLGLSVDELVAGAADDVNLATALALLASNEQRYDVLARVVRDSAPNAWAEMVQADEFNVVGPDSAAAWSAAALQPDLWEQVPAHARCHLYVKLRGPLAEPTGQRLLACKAWQSVLERANEAPPPPILFSTIAVLLPSSCRATLRTALGPLKAELSARALAVMSLLDTIESA